MCGVSGGLARGGAKGSEDGAVRFTIMTHRRRITLEIKSKMLNFNQAALMAGSV